MSGRARRRRKWTMTRGDDVFGKDMGVVFEAVKTGRRVGADRAFWSAIAHNAALFRDFVEQFQKGVEFNSGDGWDVAGWLRELDSECPYPEDRSYFNGPSRYSDYWKQYHQKLKKLFWKGDYNEDVRELCAEIEVFFVVAYVCSGVFLARFPEGQGGRNIFLHSPLMSLFGLLRGLWDGDKRIPLGSHLSIARFQQNESVRSLMDLVKNYEGNYDSMEDDAEREKEWNLYPRCREALEIQRKTLTKLISRLAAPMS